MYTSSTQPHRTSQGRQGDPGDAQTSSVDALIYANEGLNVMLTGGFAGTAASAHLPLTHTTNTGWISNDPNWTLPAELNLISVDYYCSFRTCRANFTPCELHGPGANCNINVMSKSF